MTRPRVDIGRIGVWYGMIDLLPTSEAKVAAQQIEALGYGSLWLAEAVGRDPFVSAAVLLGATERLALCTGIANVYARDPMTMSAAHKTLSEAFPDRFLLGLGVSHAHLVAGIRKHEWTRPLTFMDSYLDRMRSSLFMASGPEHEPDVVLAALGPKMLALSATKANGAHPYMTTPTHTAHARQILGDDAMLAPEQMVVLSTDAVEARRIARKYIAIYLGLPNYVNNLKQFGFDDTDFADGGSDRLIDALVAWGDVDAIAAKVSAHLDAGADHVCVQIFQDPPESPVHALAQLAPALLSL